MAQDFDFVEEAPGYYNKITGGADSYNLAVAGESNWYEDTADWVGKGIPAAAVSGVASIVNTFSYYGAKLGINESEEAINVQDTLNSIDTDLGAYYARHKDGADIGGFVLGALIPGFAGIKALRLAQSGMAPKFISAPLGLFQSRQAGIMKNMEELIQNGAVANSLTAAKIKSSAYGFGANAIDAIAIEGAVLATMSQSPVLDDYNWTSAGWNVLLGGAIGGTLTAAKVFGDVKRYAKAWDEKLLPFTTLDMPAEGIDLGSRIALMEKALADKRSGLPDIGTTGETKAIYAAATASADNLERRVREAYTEFAGGDAEVGQRVFSLFRTGSTDEVASILGGLPKISRATGGDVGAGAQEVFYANVAKPTTYTTKFVDGTLTHVENKPQVWKGVLANKPTAGVERQPGFTITSWAKVTDNVSDETADIIQLKGRIIVNNPKAVIPYKAGNMPIYMDLETGQLGMRRVIAVSDSGKVAYTAGKITAGAKSFDVEDGGRKFFASSPEVIANSPEQADAYWLAGVLAPPLHPAQVTAADLPVLQRLLSEGVNSVPQVPDIKKTLLDAKIKLSADMEVKGYGADVISRILNVDKDWVHTKQGNWTTYSAKELDKAKAPKHAVLTYNSDKLLNGMQIRNLAQVNAIEKVVIQQSHMTSASYFGSAYDSMPVSLGRDIPQSGPSFLGQAGAAELGTLQSVAEGLGRTLQTVKQKWQQGIKESTSGLAREVIEDSAMRIQGNIAVNTLRSLDYIPKYRYIPGDGAAAKATLQIIPKGKGAEPIMEMEGTLADYFHAYFSKLDEISGHEIALINATGKTTNIAIGNAFVPSINPFNVPFVAFVRYKAGHIGSDGGMTAISAPTQQSFDALVSRVQQEFGDQVDLVFKAQIISDKKIQGIYNSQLALQNTAIDSALRRKGMLGQFLPRTDEQVFGEMEEFLVRKSNNLARSYMEFNYAKDFQSLRELGSVSLQRASSKIENAKKTAKELSNPYEDAIKTALDVSRMDEYAGWQAFNKATENIFSKAHDSVRNAITKAEEGQITWQEANKHAASLGMGPAYIDSMQLATANIRIPQNELQGLVHQWNGTLVKYTLRLDHLHGVVNALSLPILFGAEFGSILRNVQKNNPNKVGALTSLLEVTIPDTGGKGKLPSATKLFYNGVKAWWTRPDLIDKFTSYGLLDDLAKEARSGEDMLTVLKPGSTYRDIKDALYKGTEKLAKLTFSDRIEQFTRFMAAHAMKELTDAAGLPEKEAFSYINTAVNRVIGAYSTNQRPMLFQGPVGSAIGLFQTYQFNLIQNLLRHVGDGDKKAVATLAGLQTSLFGLQGAPGFYHLNSYIGNQNESQGDLASSTYSIAGKEWGDWFMYGLPSNMLQTSIYTRGDVTPRHALVVPTSIADVPIVSASARLAGVVWDTAQKLKGTGLDGDILLHGLAMNGINRPLAGMAQLAMGSSITRDGKLISNSIDEDATGMFARLAGGKPLDEAIAVDAFYRQKAYEVRDRNELSILGSGIRNKIVGGFSPTNDEVAGFTEAYAARGGRLEYFNDWMIGNLQSANRSVVDEMSMKMQQQGVKNMFNIMGGKSLLEEEGVE